MGKKWNNFIFLFELIEALLTHRSDACRHAWHKQSWHSIFSTATMVYNNGYILLLDAYGSKVVILYKETCLFINSLDLFNIWLEVVNLCLLEKLKIRHNFFFHFILENNYIRFFSFFWRGVSYIAVELIFSHFIWFRRYVYFSNKNSNNLNTRFFKSQRQ
jgi:hypothetical protein